MKNDNINPIIRLIIIFFGFTYKTIQVATNIIKSSMLLNSKYHCPILKQNENIIKSIILLITIEIIFLLFVYQHIYASIGEISVIPYHIII